MRLGSRHKLIERAGSRVIERYRSSVLLLFLLWKTVTVFAGQALRFKLRGKLVVEQMYSMGAQSLGVILLSLTFVSLMLILEFTYHMELVLKQSSLVPAFSTLLLFRELGPVVTCLLINSKVGAGIAAEIGTMKVTEQIDALRLLSMDPVEYLVVPRWVGGVFSAVCLSVICVAVGLLGGAFLASAELNQSPDQFMNTMFVFARYGDLVGCVIKAAVFGTLIPVVGAHHGFRCSRGSSGVGEAATAAVVHTSILIIVSDFILTYFLYAV